MADPNSAHGRSSNAGNIGQFPHPGPPVGNNPSMMGGKAPMMSSSYPNPMNNSMPTYPNAGGPQPNMMQYGQPNAGLRQSYPSAHMPGQPPMPNAPLNQVGSAPPGTFGVPPGQIQGANTSTSPSRPPGTFGAPPGTFGAPPSSQFRGVGAPHSATPPPMATGGLLTAPTTAALNRSSSTPLIPPAAPGQFGAPNAHQPLMNGVTSRTPGPSQPPVIGPPSNQPGPMSVNAQSIRPGVAPSPGSGPLARPPSGNPPLPSPHNQGPPRPGVPPPLRPVAPPPQNQDPSAQMPGGRPNELPLPYHGHGQYSHQVPGFANMTTPGLTPNTSEPPSQKSSRAPSPVAGQKYDALEGQFTPSGQLSTQNSQQDLPTSSPPYMSTLPGQTYPAAIPAQTSPPGAPNMAVPPGQVPHAGVPGQMGPPVSSAPSSVPWAPPSSVPGGQAPPGSSYGVPSSSVPTPQSFAPSNAAATSSGPGITGRRQYPQMAPPYGSQAAPPYSTSSAMPSQPGTMPNSAPGVIPQPGAPSYPANSTYPGHSNAAALNANFSNMKLQPDSQRPVNLLQEKNILPSEPLEAPTPNLPTDYKKANCHPEIFRCTLNCIPNTQSLLNKSRLPLGILIHPFKDLAQLPVIQSSVIVRCRSCRTYINPFVTFVDMRRWKCNLCYRTNELPEEFNYDPVSKTYGEPQRRPEIRSGTIEFIAPSEYMLRPPQPAVYLFVLDVSYNARETGYLQAFCQILHDELERLPGDARTQIGFLAFDSSLYFFNLAEGLSQPQLLVVSDTEEVFLPCPDNLLANLQESRELVSELLNILPEMFKNNMETGSALGPALEAAFKLMSPTGGRMAVFQTLLPNVGNGALKSREDPNERSGKKVQHLGPATDFYKRMALDCSAQQIGVDLFLLNSQYADIASIGCVSKFSGGSVHYFPAYHSVTNPSEAERFDGVLRRYLTRKVGFEAVMRIRCSRGLSIHTFHGNFFVRSTDLLSLPNVNPDAGFGMQMSIEDTIETNYVCFQAALLYTSSKGERRIRVHTIAVPITQQLSEVHINADQAAVVSLLAKMAVDKSLSSSLSDARDALINSSIDMLSSYGSTLASSQRQGMLPCPYPLRVQPLLTLGLLKSLAFRVGLSTKVDERVYNMEMCKNLPVSHLLMMVYPNLYPVHNLDDKNNVLSKEDSVIPQPPILQLSSAHMDRHGAYLMDTCKKMFLWVGAAISDQFCRDVLDKPNFSSIPDLMFELPELENPTSELMRAFVGHLNDQRPFPAALIVMREDSRSRMHFLEHMVEDRTESTFSYYEFLQHLQKEIRS